MFGRPACYHDHGRGRGDHDHVYDNDDGLFVRITIVVMIPMMMIPGMYVPPCPVGQGKGLPCKMEALPPPPRPVKITKTCGAQRGNVDFNPLKFGIQFFFLN